MFLLVFVLTFSTTTLHAQGDSTGTAEEIVQKVGDLIPPSGNVPHVYRINYPISVGFSLAASAANVYAIPKIIKAKDGLTQEELMGISHTKHNGFDRWALKLDPTKRDQFYAASDYVLPVIIASAATLGFDKKIRKDWARILMMYYEMHAVTFSLYNFSPFGPAFQNKLRPYSYYDHFTDEQRKTGNNRNSLYSGHTASAAAASFFMVKVYADYHPELGNKKYLLYSLATVPPLIEGYLRMKALAHFPSDILVGLVIGAVCGVVVPDLHKIRNKRNITLGMISSPIGPGLSLGWKPNYESKRTFTNYNLGLD